jgi:poly-gamma-glutamate synthesis protein (capsule biosynthesis protein)
MLGTPSRNIYPQGASALLIMLTSLMLALLLGACAVPAVGTTDEPVNVAANIAVNVAAEIAPTAIPLHDTNGAPAPLPPNPGGVFPTSAAPSDAGAFATADDAADEGSSTVGQGEAFAPADQPTPLSLPTPTPSAFQPASPAGWAVSGPVEVAISPALPEEMADALRSALQAITTLEGANGAQPLTVAARWSDAATGGVAPTRIEFAPAVNPGAALASRYYAVVAPFDTVQDDITLDDLTARWDGAAIVYTSDDALTWLPALLGQPAASTEAVAPEALIDLLQENRDAIAIIPFEQIDPRFKVLTVDDANLLSNQLQEGDYPLVAQIQVNGEGAEQLQALLGAVITPGTNRDPANLTTLVMTGVTAMARGTAAAIERVGDPAYPARIIGPELALADITHVSNEIPFIEGCVVNNTLNNLQLCSDPSYWEALELMGTDIVGLSGNHVNDFGRDGARESLGWYKENKIPVYGSGLTVDSACAPLLWESNGNTFAFIAALAYGPESAWVTDEEPGSCYYYEHKDRIISTIETLSKAVDIVAVELQYEETYFPWPTPAQVEEFRELRAAGADLVTGVQSHVPQAQEPYGAFDEGGDGFISYGLGNLYFDQMWSWETRTELYARHAIYDGRLINTEILTGVLEDYAQPRWTTPEERADLLQTIFDAAPNRP